MAQESLEIALNGKPLFMQEVEPLTLLKLYITKAQEYALICKSLENLYKSLESADNLPQQSVQIEALGNML